MKWLKLTLCILLHVSSALSADSCIYNDVDGDEIYRLPENFIPTLYTLSLAIFPENTDYTGTVNITFDVVKTNETVDKIYLHIDPNFIAIDSIVLNNELNCTFGTPNEAEILAVDCSEIPTGSDNYLYIEFVAAFSTEDGYGMVKNSYVDQGEQQLLVQSFLKPIHARRAFPCMDEPDLTARFSIEITHPSDYTAITNSPVLDEKNYYILQTTTFETTPKISTYLVSIFLSKFQSANSTSDGDESKIFTRTEVANLTNTAAYYYSQIMDQFVNYTGTSYESLGDTGCYQVAVPDYYVDSMGDFGLFTYRESDLLDEGNKTTKKALQNMVTTMAYKISHEWYGGAIATKWWSDVWANEGVATYLKYVIANQTEEEFEIMDQFIVEVIQKSLQYDAMPFVEPLSSNISYAFLDIDIENKFDEPMHLKGASILNMINYILGGPEQFKYSLQYHWGKRQGLDTDTYDLLMDLVESEYRYYLYKYIETYAYSAGFPMLIVNISSVTDDSELAKVTQKRFVYPMFNMPYLPDTEWTIPLTYAYPGWSNFDIQIVNDFYVPTDYTLNIYYCKDCWIIFNVKGLCYYRVNYEETLWRRIVNVLKDEASRTTIHVLSRAQLVDDIFNIARIGDVDYSLAFELADFLANETEYYPWYSAFNAFSYLLGKLDSEEMESQLKIYILDLMTNVLDVPSFVHTFNETHIEMLKMEMVMTWACRLGNSECINYATEYFEDFMETGRIVDNNLRGVIFCNGIRYSENVGKNWNFLWKIYKSSASVHEQNDVLNALGCAEDKDILKEYLLKTITIDSSIKRQDVLIVFKSVFASYKGLDAAMEFLEDNFTDVKAFYKDMHILTEMTYAVSEKLLTSDQIDWLEFILNDETFEDCVDIKINAPTLASVNYYWATHYQSVIREIFLPSTSTVTERTTTATSSTSTSETDSSIPYSTPTTSRTTTEGSKSGRIASEKFIILALIFLALKVR